MNPNNCYFDPLTMPDPSPIMDGFTYNLNIRHTAMNYYPLALDQLEVIRRANLMRPRWYVVPTDQDQPVAAYDTVQYQTSVTPGSYLWAVTVIVYDGAYNPVVGTDILLQVTDACSGVSLFNDFVTGSGLQTEPNAPNNLGYPVPQLLSSPRLILEPGLVSVEVANRSGSSVTAQTVLYFAEPCLMTGEGQG
jgi:hypothetical protein